MRVDDRVRLIWFVRSWLGPRGHIALANKPVNPATDPGLRQLLIVACNWNTGKHPFADDRGLLRHAPGQLVDEQPTDVYPWDAVWQLISPGITDERVAELNAAWAGGGQLRARRGLPASMRMHLACCAFYSPPPKPVQLDLLELIGAGSR